MAADDAATLLDVQQEVCALTHVRPVNQKLLAPVASQRIAQALRSGAAGTTTIRDLGLRGSLRMTVVGAVDAEVEQIQHNDAQARRLHEPRRLHPSMLKDAKPRNTSEVLPPVFGRCEAHPSTPRSSSVHEQVVRYLEQLASDPAIVHVCRAHGYQVGVLTELLPHENPELLGLNENKGQRILLRVRTDGADGMRDYKTTRRVLVHELAHNEISDHPPEFKILNSQLNREVDAYEEARTRGAHVLSSQPMYDPGDVDEEREERRIR
ncbi:hypothetical protein MCAP1_002982, partial [Malassezia caprae]